MLTTQQQEWFDQLHIRNSQASETFKLPEFANVFRGVIDKYSDSAHFVYELLQNADDAGATEVDMQLDSDKFIFTHNGSVRFTVSNPERIEEDRASGRLGHINSICYIGFSSKDTTTFETGAQNKIGKFGVGFKAVFQYTRTPEVYDDPFCFRIDDWIVPSIIDGSSCQRKNHTVIVIPFNRQSVAPERAYDEILQKLKELSFPQLFLNHIQKISWHTLTESNDIVKELECEGESHNIRYGLYTLHNSFAHERRKVLLLSRSVAIPNVGTHDVTIGYYMERGRILTKDSYNINCFFPTNESIGTCYVIHAPFALVDNRQQIKRYSDINNLLFQSIAELAADSLLVLRDWNGQDKIKLLGDNIVDFVRYNTQSFTLPYTKNIGDKFAENYQRIFNNEAIFLSRTGQYLTIRASFWADKDTRDILDDTQLERLMQLSYGGARTCGFVLCSVNRSDLERSGILLSKFDGDEFARRITSDFMKEQSNEWLAKFYTFVKENRLSRHYYINRGLLSTAPMRRAKIVKVQTGEFVSAYNEANELDVYNTEDEAVDSSQRINASLILGCAPFRDIINELGVKSLNQFDSLRIKLAKYQELSKEETNELLVSVIRYYDSCDSNAQAKIIQVTKENFCFFADEMNFDEHRWWIQPENVYGEEDLLKQYYIASGLRGKFFIASDYYAAVIDAVGEGVFNHFVVKLGFRNKPPYTRKEVALQADESYHRQHKKIKEKMVNMIDGLDSVLTETLNESVSEELSHYIWNLIVEYSRENNDFFANDISEYSIYHTNYKQDWGGSSLIDAIRRSQWFYIDGVRRSLAQGIYREELEKNGPMGQIAW